MPKRVKQRQRSADINQIAQRLVEMSPDDGPEPVPEARAETPPASISEYMASIGRKGGKVGGKRRLETMSARKRSKIASEAAKARWDKKRKNSD